MGVPQPPESFKDSDVKRYHIHFSPFYVRCGNKGQQIECGRQCACLSYFPLLEKGSLGHVFQCLHDTFVLGRVDIWLTNSYLFCIIFKKAFVQSHLEMYY